MNVEFNLRPACDFDGAEIACLIDRIYREHGDRLAARRGDRDLVTLEECFWRRGGAFVVIETRHERSNAGEIVGTAALLPQNCIGAAGLRRFYVDAAFRGRGAGRVLMKWAVAWARLRGFERLEFWSDSRFEKGHHFFEKLGLSQLPQTREMTDGVNLYREALFTGSVRAITEKL
jgi:putative acetyltransferase